MLSKLRMIVLVALMLMAITSPMLQVDSLDSFPVCSDDLELLVMFCLCLLGMVLVFAHLFKLIPISLRSVVPLVLSVLSTTRLLLDEWSNTPTLSTAPPPLRI